MKSDSILYLLQFAGIGTCCALLQIGWAGGESHTLSVDAKAHTMKQIIRIPDAPKSPLYSQAVRVGPHIYVTGIPGIDPSTNKVAGPTIQEQTRQALINCKQVLRAAGASLDDVVDVQVLLARPEDFAGLNEEYAKFFRTDPPARSVARLGPDLGEIIVSIRMTAYVAE